MRILENHYQAVRRYKVLARLKRVVIFKDGNLGWMMVFLKGNISYASYHRDTWEQLIEELPRLWRRAYTYSLDEETKQEMDMTE
jgi:hypothetical protein